MNTTLVQIIHSIFDINSIYLLLADIDECSDTSLHTCDEDDTATCTNNEGGYTCTCPTGYKWSDSSVSCEGNFATSR